jgi:F-type H+-transporting ATPase subunit epsilon
MQVQLVSPEREVFSGEASAVYARTTDGELGVLPEHSPMIGTLVEAPVRIERPGGEDILAAVHGGFLSVLESGVSILGELVELAVEIDVSRARAALERYRGADADDAEAQGGHRRAVARLRTLGEAI